MIGAVRKSLSLALCACAWFTLQAAHWLDAQIAVSMFEAMIADKKPCGECGGSGLVQEGHSYDTARVEDCPLCNI